MKAARPDDLERPGRERRFASECSGANERAHALAADAIYAFLAPLVRARDQR